MKQKILKAIIVNWFLEIYSDITFQKFFGRILILNKLFKILGLTRKDTIAIYGKNSYNWIVVYLSCLFSGIRTVIIHPDEEQFEVFHILNLTGTRLLFVDDDIAGHFFVKSLFIQMVVDITSLKVIYNRNQDVLPNVLIDILLDEENTLLPEYKTVLKMSEEESLEDFHILTATSGTTNFQPKWVVSNSNAICKLIEMAKDKIPFDSTDFVHSKVDFAESHFLTVLLPFVKGCKFTGYEAAADVYIEDSYSFKKKMDKINVRLYSNKLWVFLFENARALFLYKILARKNMAKYYNKNTKAVIIYNCNLSNELVSMFRKVLPVYTTYGSQETNQLLAINDFSTKEKRSIDAVGTILPGVSIINQLEEIDEWGTEEMNIGIISPALFTRYFADNNYTELVRYGMVYTTDDICYIGKDQETLYLKGRKSAIYRNEYGIPFQLDRLEKILSFIPFIKQIVFFTNQKEDNTKELIALIYPNKDVLEAMHYGLLKTKDVLERYRKIINMELDNFIDIKRLYISNTPLITTKNGNICRNFYKI